MVRNREYAEEIIRYSTDYAQKEGHDDLAELAEKMAAVMLPVRLQATYRPSYDQAELRYEGPSPIRYMRGIR